MKKFVLIGAFFVLVLGTIWFYNDQMKNTLFGEVFKEVFDDTEITEVIIDTNLKNRLQNRKSHDEDQLILDEETFRELMSQSSEMKIKETDRPPMTTYEITIRYKSKEEQKMKVTAIVVGYNNTLQMVNGKFYTIKGRNDLFESIYGFVE